MPNFFWRDAEDRWFERFPRWALGANVWREFAPGLEVGDLRPVEELKALRRDEPPQRRLRCPRVFISHKQEDVGCALEIARIVQGAGMEFWLDVTDPGLREIEERQGQRMTPAQKALATAMVIEMALLNSSHVIAVLTENTARSRWVPYEYGRVKEDSVRSVQAASWKHPDLPTREMGEYLHLGAVLDTATEIESWVRVELQRWPGAASCPRDPWTDADWARRPDPSCPELRGP